MGFSWIPREAPPRRPQPAVPFRHFEAAVKPSDFLPAPLREPLGQGRFRQRVADRAGYREGLKGLDLPMRRSDYRRVGTPQNVIRAEILVVDP